MEIIGLDEVFFGCQSEVQSKYPWASLKGAQGKVISTSINRSVFLLHAEQLINLRSGHAL